MRVIASLVSNTISKYNEHSHDDGWEITYMIKGTCIATVKGRGEYNLEQGDFIILPPDSLHSGKSKDTFMDMSVIIERLPISQVCVLKDYDGSIRVLMNLICRAMVEKPKEYRELCSSLAECLYHYISNLMSSPNKYPFLNHLKDIMYDNISNADFDLRSASDKLGYNVDYVRRCFKEEFGTTPLKYITDMRLRHAKKLIAHNSYVSIEQVADQCGFSDSFYFSTVFKKKYGIPPREYRKIKNESS